MMLVSKRCDGCGGAERTLDDCAKRLSLRRVVRTSSSGGPVTGGSGKTTVGAFQRKCGICRMQDSLKSAVCSRCLLSLPREKYRPEDWRRASIVANSDDNKKESTSSPLSSPRPSAAGAACLACLEELRKEENTRQVEAMSVGYLCPIFSWIYHQANRARDRTLRNRVYRTPLNVPDLALTTHGNDSHDKQPKMMAELVGEYDVIFYVGQDYRGLDKVYYSRRTRGIMSLQHQFSDDDDDDSSLLRGKVKMDASTWRYVQPEGGELEFTNCEDEEGLVGIKVDGDRSSSGFIKFVKTRTAAPLCADGRTLTMKMLEAHEKPQNWPVTIEEADRIHKGHCGEVRQTWLCDKLGLPDLAAARVGEYLRPPPFFFFEEGDLWMQFHDDNLHRHPLVLVARRRLGAGEGL